MPKPTKGMSKWECPRCHETAFALASEVYHECPVHMPGKRRLQRWEKVGVAE